MAGTDSISRQDAIETVHHSIFDFFKNSENEEKFLTERDKLLLSINKAICNNIKALPSAERKGKWVERHPMRYDGKFVGADTDIIPDTRIRHLYCGECDKQMPIFEKFPYCPYCGADMRGEQDG